MYSLAVIPVLNKSVVVILLSIFALTPAPIWAYPRSLLGLSALTPAPIRAHSCAYPRSIPHMLMHEYLQDNDKSQ